MSRIGKQPVPIPAGVQVTVEDSLVRVRGPKGRLEQAVPPGIEVRVESEPQQVVVTRQNDERQSRACHGLIRSLIANMVRGVTEGYSRALEVIGVGYNLQLQGKTLIMQIGFANPVHYSIPDGIEVEIQNASNPGRLVVRGCSKQLVGQVAAGIRAVRPPEPYQGKGVRYAGEAVRRKAGKAFTSG